MAEDIQLKLLEIMRETLPGMRRVAVITNPTNPSSQTMLDLLRSHAEKAGLVVDAVSVSAPADLDTAFAEMSRQPPGAVMVLSDNSLFALSEQIVARALALRAPTFGNFALSFVQSGGMFAYSRDPREAFQGVARLLKKILDGANPGELPFEQPTKFNLYINLKTAKALGIEIPPKLLATANEVIE
jgi:putative ABC transport system substrate-binding protein